MFHKSSSGLAGLILVTVSSGVALAATGHLNIAMPEQAITAPAPVEVASVAQNAPVDISSAPATDTKEVAPVAVAANHTVEKATTVDADQAPKVKKPVVVSNQAGRVQDQNQNTTSNTDWKSYEKSRGGKWLERGDKHVPHLSTNVRNGTYSNIKTSNVKGKHVSKSRSSSSYWIDFARTYHKF